MKKWIAILGSLLLLLVVLAVVTPFLVPTETYKNQIQKRVQAATGRDLDIAGEIGFSLLPSTELTVKNVAFSNASWAGTPQMARLDSLRVKVDPFALLSGNLEIQSFVLEKPVIELAVNAQGEANWTFGTGASPDGTQQTTGTGQSGGTGGAPLADISLENVRLVDGRVTYSDATTGARYELTEVNLSLALASLDASFSADGSLAYNGETLEVSLETGPPRGLMAGETTPVTLGLESNPLTLDYDGALTNAAPRKIDGQVDLAIPSLRGLAEWAGEPIDAAPGTLETFKLAGEVAATGPRYAFTAETLQLDKIKGQGRFSADLSGARPVIEGELQLARLDVTPYMPPPTEDADAGSDGQAEAGPTEWRDTPIDLSPLKTAEVDFDLSVEAIKARDIEVGQSELGVRLNNGDLIADLRKLTLYGGKGSGKLRVNGRSGTPQVGASFDLNGVDAEPLLTDAAGFERLQGTGDMRFEVAAQGASQKALVNDLDGEGAISFKDGAIVGINLAQMVRNVGSAFTGGGETQKTDFAELAGTFTITDGLLRNDDLLMLNPLLRIRGKGTADIPARSVDYRVTPKAVASLEGQGGDVEESGVAVPVIIEGPWHDIGYRPDLRGMMEGVVKDPAKLRESTEEAVKSLKSGGNIGDVLKGLSGGGESAADDGGGGSGETGETAPTGGSDAEKSLKDAKDKLKSLFE